MSKKIYEYTEEEVKAFGTMELNDEPMDFSYPEGYFKFINTLQMLPDTASRNGVMGFYFYTVCYV